MYLKPNIVKLRWKSVFSVCHIYCIQFSDEVKEEAKEDFRDAENSWLVMF